MSTKRKNQAKFAPPSVKSAVKVPTKSTIDESRTAVSAIDNIQSSLKQTQETIEISSDSDSEDVSDDEEESDAENAMNGVETNDGTQPGSKPTPSRNGTLPPALNTKARPSASNAITDDPATQSDGEAASPSFGELVRGTIDVPAMLAQQADGTTLSTALTHSATPRNLAPPSLSSLSTVLTQALRTEDTDLLESCLQVTNIDSIQQTIERLDSSLAGVLLTKLAARFHKRPGRAGSLMLWVKWTLVTHGGVLAVQPKILERLVALQKVLNERSRGLPSLLALKGKLDMLDAQMQMRQSRQRRSADDEDDSDEEGAIYVEGEDGDEGSDVIVNANGAGLLGGLDNSEDVDVDIAPTTNGFIADSDVDDSDAVEVIELDSDNEVDDSLDEDEVDHDDVEDSMDEEDDSDADAAPPTKVQKTARSFGRGR